MPLWLVPDAADLLAARSASRRVRRYPWLLVAPTQAVVIVASILTMAHQQQMLHAERWMSRAAELQESCPFTLLHGICSVLVAVGINSNCGMDSGVLRAHPPLKETTFTICTPRVHYVCP